MDIITIRQGTVPCLDYYGADGTPYGLNYNGTMYYYVVSLQGDIIKILDGNGNVVVNYVYDTWGNVYSITGSQSNYVGADNPLRYRGYYYDTELELYYLQSRYYDPETGRFISADVLLVAGDSINGTNMFAYCCNNPVMFVDPSGRDSNGMAIAAYALVSFNELDIIGFKYLNDLLKDYYNSDKDARRLSDAINKVWESIEWIAYTFKTGTTIHGIEDAVARINGYSKEIGAVIDQSPLDVIFNYFSNDDIGNLFEIYGKELENHYLAVRAKIIPKSINAIINLATGLNSKVLNNISSIGSVAEVIKAIDLENIWKEIFFLKP